MRPIFNFLCGIGSLTTFMACLPSMTAWGADFTVVNSGASAYNINGFNNPGLTLHRGKTYTFAITATGHPFWIKTVPGTGTGNGYTTGVATNGLQSGTLTLVLPSNAPDTLYYNCQFHAPMTGVITVIDPPVPSAPVILNLNVGTNLNLKFTGSNTFSYFPEYNTNLTTTNWSALTIQTNVYLGGTNDVICGKPPADNVFIRVRAQ